MVMNVKIKKIKSDKSCQRYEESFGLGVRRPVWSPNSDAHRPCLHGQPQASLCTCARSRDWPIWSSMSNDAQEGGRIFDVYKRESLIHRHLTQTLSSLWLESDTDAWWPNKPLQRSAASITLRWRVHCRKGEEKQTVRIIFSSLTITSIVTTAGFKQRDHMVILYFWFSNLAAH